MLKTKKLFLMIAVICLSVAGLYAQSGTAGLTQRYLEKANTFYENAEYSEAYKTVNAVLKLNESTGIPANAALIATQIYSKMLDQVKENRDYAKFSEITANLEKYPVIADSSTQQKVKAIYAQQEAELEAKREAAAKAEREEQQALYQSQLEEQRKNQNTFMEAMQKNNETMLKSNESVMNSIVEVSEKMSEATQQSAKSNHMVLVAVLIVCFVIILIFVIIILVIRVAAKASVRQSMQFEETLKLVQGMTQQNSQILLGNITQLQGLGGPGLRSAGSSRWGVDALPAPEMTDEEKDELKVLAVKCEELGAKIDAVTRRKNNSKNISEMVYKLSMALGLNQNTSMLYFCAAMVYDAGFLSVPEEILESTSITEEQREVIKQHVLNGGEHLDFVPEKYKKIFEDASHSHHENEDGSGYPEGLSRNEIPQIAKIIHVVESYNSLISRRNYRQIKDKESAIEELHQHSDMYDQDVVSALDSIV